MLDSRLDDFADSGERNSVDIVRKLGSDDDKLVFLSAMQDVSILCFRPSRKPVLINTGRDFGFLENMSQIRGQAVTHIDHCVSFAGRHRTNVESRLWKE